MKNLTAILLLLSATARSQDSLSTLPKQVIEPYKKGSYVLTLSTGFLNGYRDEYSLPATFEKGNTAGFLPIYAKGEYGVSNKVSLAVTAAYNVLYFNSFHLYPGYYGPIRRYTTDKFRYFSGGLTAYYHLGSVLNVNRLDPFIGVGAVINNIKNSALPQGDSVVEIKKHSITPYLKVGARYYASDKVALFADAGYDKLSIFSIGFSCRFGSKATKG
ncbi:MAG: hypothetical protein KF744_04660 [Taibaiella sp.]|nr:hypothetical protein [Taibaiella sp.]